MKKILPWIFSIALTASAANTASAQLMHKSGAADKTVTPGILSEENSRSLLDNPGIVPLQFTIVPGQLQNGRTYFAPAREAQESEGVELPDLKGCVTYMNTWTAQTTAVGLYTLPTSADGEFTQIVPKVDATYGGVAVDGTYYATSVISYMGVNIVTVKAYDIASGTMTKQWSPSDFSILGAAGYTYDKVSDKIYGITYNSNATSYQLSEISFGEEVNVTAIAELDGYWNSVAADKDGQLYGIKCLGTQSGSSFIVSGSQLVKFNKTDGSYELIGETGQLPQYMSSAAIDPISNRMFWTIATRAAEGILCEVNTSTGVATPLFHLPGEAQVLGLYVNAPLAAAKAPAAVTNLSATFPDGKLVGSLTFDVPATLYDGTPATGYVKYKVTANGDLVDLASVAYGETVTIEPVTVYETGIVEFCVVLTNEAGDSPRAKTSCFVGNGVPEGPKNVTAEYDGSAMNISWNAVTTSADGGYVNPEEVTYTVVEYPGAVQVAKNIKALSVSKTLAAPAKFTKYYYEVTATFSGNTSVTGVSNNVYLGALDTPYEVEFNSSEVLEPYTIIDGNNDGKKWTLVGEELRMNYNMTKAMDDWLITPPFSLKGGNAYLVSVTARAHSASYSERIEVKAGQGTAADDMTLEALPPTDIKLTTHETYSHYFVAPEDGTYNFGIHGISDADRYYLYLGGFSVSAGIPAEAPAAGQIAVTPDPTGEYKVAVSMTTPAFNLAGDPVGKLTKAELYRGETLINTFNSPRASAALSFNDVLEECGTQTYTFVCYTAAGKGEEVSATCFVGTDKPAVPQNVYLQENDIPGYLTLSWDAVNTDAYGNPINPANVAYNIWTINSDGTLNETIAQNLHITAFTFEAFEPDCVQHFVQYALEAVTEGGYSLVGTELVPVGKAYNGMLESFANGNLSGNYILGVMSYGSSYFRLADDTTVTGIPSCDGDNGYIYCKTDQLSASNPPTAVLLTGKISLAEFENPVFSFYTVPYTSFNRDVLTVEVRDVMGTYEVVYQKAMNQIGNKVDWYKITIPLDEFKGKDIQIRMSLLINSLNMGFYDRLFVGNQLENDLIAYSISAPEEVKVGETFNVNVKVANEGSADAENFKVELYKDGELEAVQEVESLASDTKTTVTFGQTMSNAATEPVSYKAVIVYDEDEDVENNETSFIAVDPILSTLPGVNDLKAEGAQKGNVLIWSEPVLKYVESTTEDFENATGWAHEMEGWKFVDVDGEPVSGFSNYEIPGIVNGITTSSFFVFDNGEFNNGTLGGHSGDKYLVTLFRADDGQIDDWAISPELTGDAQTISFWARSYSAEYPESIEVLYSTTGTEIEDFVPCEGAKWEGLPADWVEYSAKLPENAKYFAIRSFATGSFLLMVDDVTYKAAATPEVELTVYGYEVYRDGVKISGNELVEECKFLDVDVTNGVTYNYAVIPVFDLGVGSPTFVEATSGIDDVAAGVVITTSDRNVVVLGADGLEVMVCAVDGKVLYSGEGTDRTVVPVSNGIYIVRAGAKVAKVIVK